MEKKKILFASSEAVPFIKTGGLADVVGSLPAYFDPEKYEVRIMIPLYACMEHRDQLNYVTEFQIRLGWRKQYVGIWEAYYEGIHYYFIDNEFYFAGSRPYGEIYEDVEKFAFFSMAVLESLPKIAFIPDIIHCNDWQTGLIPVYLDCFFKDRAEYGRIHTVFSIHNIKFQGRWRITEVMDKTGLPERYFTPDCLEAYGESNYLKAGILYSDAVITVSESYAHEIMTPEGGAGLDGVLHSCSHKVYGILNGLDYKIFDPANDPYVPVPFDVAHAAADKPDNKKILQCQMNLPAEKDRFLLAMVSRMTDQKGFDLVAYVLEELLASGELQMVVLGSGEERYEQMFHYFAGKYPDRLAARIGYSEDMAHLIYASADAFLMPSLFEPCGLSQLMSLRYGTVPIVRETGGLRDTVEPYNKYEDSGTGFSFANYNAQEMKDQILAALNLYRTDPPAWKRLMMRGMQQDFSWKKSVKKYQKIYRMLLSRES